MTPPKTKAKSPGYKPEKPARTTESESEITQNKKIINQEEKVESQMVPPTIWYILQDICTETAAHSASLLLAPSQLLHCGVLVYPQH